jgi:hypothetical protein
MQGGNNAQKKETFWSWKKMEKAERYQNKTIRLFTRWYQTLERRSPGFYLGFFMQCVKPYWSVKENMAFPCGQCMACRINKTHEWATRLMHEYESWEEGVFVTLTYDELNVPKDFSLNKEVLRNYIKRVRKDIAPKKIKYFAVGEYGDLTGRPHYHLIVFGMSPRDHNVFYRNWQMCDPRRLDAGTVTYDSARYVAGYVQKKLNGQKAVEQYGDKQPPFMLVSQGIGRAYAFKYADEFRKELGYTIRGNEVGLPRYYRKVLEIDTELLREKANFRELEIKNELISRNILPGQAQGEHRSKARKQRGDTLRTKSELFRKGSQ